MSKVDPYTTHEHFLKHLTVFVRDRKPIRAKTIYGTAEAVKINLPPGNYKDSGIAAILQAHLFIPVLKQSLNDEEI